MLLATPPPFPLVVGLPPHAAGTASFSLHCVQCTRTRTVRATTTTTDLVKVRLRVLLLHVGASSLCLRGRRRHGNCTMQEGRGRLDSIDSICSQPRAHAPRVQ
jgi:hypothetical protein